MGRLGKELSRHSVRLLFKDLTEQPKVVPQSLTSEVRPQFDQIRKNAVVSSDDAEQAVTEIL